MNGRGLVLALLFSTGTWCLLYLVTKWVNR